MPDSSSSRMIHLLARVYTQTNYQTNYLFFAQVRPDESSVSGINVPGINRINTFLLKNPGTVDSGEVQESRGSKCSRIL